MAMTGIQMAAAHRWRDDAVAVFGVLAQNITMQLYPWALLAMLVLMFILAWSSCIKDGREAGKELPKPSSR